MPILNFFSKSFLRYILSMGTIVFIGYKKWEKPRKFINSFFHGIILALWRITDNLKLLNLCKLILISKLFQKL